MIGAAQATLVSGNQPWTPADATIALWLDASDSSTVIRSDGIITAWNDKSSNHYSAAPTVPPPTYTLSGLNGRNVITFNSANNEYFEIFSGLTSGTYSGSTNLYWVAKRTNANGGIIFTERLSGTNRVFSAAMVGEYCIVTTDAINGSGNYWVVNNDYPITASAFIGSQTLKPGVGCSLWWNGSSIALRDGSETSNATGNLGCRIGNRENANFCPWDGFIAELIVELVDAETSRRQKFEGYLAHKWGLGASLPGGHPYRYKRP